LPLTISVFLILPSGPIKTWKTTAPSIWAAFASAR
jgi:hypothetical protein